MAGIKIESGSNTAGSPNVDANYNLNVNLPTTNSQAGFVSPTYLQDAGAITGSKLFRNPEVSYDSRIAVGTDTLSALYNFTATAQNTGDFKYVSSTMTCTQSSGFLNLNAISSNASGNYTYMQGWKYFSQLGPGDIKVEFTGAVSAAVPANQILEAGLFIGTAGVAPADGVFFRLTDAGLRGYVSYSGTETPTGVIAASITPNIVAKFKIIIGQRQVSFWVDDVLGGIINTPSGNPTPYAWLNLPICMMMRNSGVVTGGYITRIGTINVSQLDLAVNKPWPMQKSLQGDAYQGQDGDTMGPSCILTNAATAAAAALVNATAAAQFTGLGGLAQVLPTLTAGTDGILFSYLNPVGSVTQPPKTLIVTGVHISSGVTTVLTGGPLVLAYSVAYGSSSVTLATASETASFTSGTVKLHRRVPLGIQNYVAAAAVGVGAPDVIRGFYSPIVVHPGEYFNIVCRNLGTVTTLGAVAIMATVDHFYE